jgi:hypothetical protein
VPDYSINSVSISPFFAAEELRSADQEGMIRRAHFVCGWPGSNAAVQNPLPSADTGLFEKFLRIPKVFWRAMKGCRELPGTCYLSAMHHRGKSILIGLCFVVVSLPLYALSFGPCGGGYITLIPGAILFLIGVGRVITAFIPAR